MALNLGIGLDGNLPEMHFSILEDGMEVAMLEIAAMELGSEISPSLVFRVTNDHYLMTLTDTFMRGDALKPKTVSGRLGHSTISTLFSKLDLNVAWSSEINFDYDFGMKIELLEFPGSMKLKISMDLNVAESLGVEVSVPEFTIDWKAPSLGQVGGEDVSLLSMFSDGMHTDSEDVSAHWDMIALITKEQAKAIGSIATSVINGGSIPLVISPHKSSTPTSLALHLDFGNLAMSQGLALNQETFHLRGRNSDESLLSSLLSQMDMEFSFDEEETTAVMAIQLQLVEDDERIEVQTTVEVNNLSSLGFEFTIPEFVGGWPNWKPDVYNVQDDGFLVSATMESVVMEEQSTSFRTTLTLSISSSQGEDIGSLIISSLMKGESIPVAIASDADADATNDANPQYLFADVNTGSWNLDDLTNVISETTQEPTSTKLFDDLRVIVNGDAFEASFELGLDLPEIDCHLLI